MDYVIVPVTSGEMTIVAPNGERSKAQLGVGKSYFRKAGVEHDVLNETDAEIVFLEVELKPAVSVRLEALSRLHSDDQLPPIRRD